MSSLTLTLSDEEVKRITRKVQQISPKERPAVFENAFAQVGQAVLEKLRANVSNKILHRRTGNLAKSLNYRVNNDGGDISAVIGSGVLTGSRMRYASIQERGGVVKGKPWLTVPLKAALTGAGVMKMPRARDYPDTFIRKGKSGNPIIFQKKGKSIVPLFVLKKSVTIPPSRYMATSLSQSRAKILSTLNRVLAENIAK